MVLLRVKRLQQKFRRIIIGVSTKKYTGRTHRVYSLVCRRHSPFCIVVCQFIFVGELLFTFALQLSPVPAVSRVAHDHQSLFTAMRFDFLIAVLVAATTTFTTIAMAFFNTGTALFVYCKKIN